MARTFQATLTLTRQGQRSVGRVPLDDDVVSELGLRPGESVKASLRNNEFIGRVHGSPSSPGLLIPIEIITKLGLREGQGVKVSVHGRP
ncbi:MAG: hypothetical protein ACLGH3_09130 [Actinomycetota bacterium]